MVANPDGLIWLGKYSKLPIERITYFPAANQAVVNAIHRGIVFQMAFWSGPSVQAFVKLTDVISKLDPWGNIELVVVDIDEPNELANISPCFASAGGAGETAWIREGKVVADSGRGVNVECFGPNTELLLEMS